MTFITRALRQFSTASQSQLENFGMDRFSALGDQAIVFRASFDNLAGTGRALFNRLSHDPSVLGDSPAGSMVTQPVGTDALTLTAPVVTTPAANDGTVVGSAVLIADVIGFGGNAYLLTSANLAAIGADTNLAHWDKLQMGLADIYIESQLGLSGLTGASRDAALSGFTSANSAANIDQGYVAIDAVAANGNGAELLAALEALGMQRGASFQSFAGGLIPIDALDELANLDLLAFARPVYAETNAGSVQSQNVASMNVDYVQATYGLTGAGVSIGFLSDSFNTATLTTGGGALTIHYAQDVATGDLPAGVNILADAASASVRDEGRAMAQLAFDIAPGASLSFHTAFVSMADFAQGIIDLKTAGAKIIVDDVRYFAEPFFQDGIVAQAVDTVVAGGAMYFSSAGNQGTASYASATWRPSGQFITVGAVLYELYDFDPGAGIDFVQAVTKSGTITSVLNWDQPNFSVSGGAGAQSDMVFFNVNGASFATLNTANIGGDAIDAFQNGGAFTGVAIGLRVGDVAPNYFQYVLAGSVTINEFASNSGTSYGHSNAAGAISVGASDWVDSGRFAAPYVAGEPMPYLETFSSRGDIPILFNTAGVRLSAPIYRSNVDFTAGDGGNNTFFGSDNPNSGAYTGFEADTSPNFYGTSAAAPNAAAIAALLMQRFPTATNAQIEQALKMSAIDVQVTFAGTQIGDGVDNRSGWGLIQADRAVQALQAMLNSSTQLGVGEAAFISYETDTSAGGSPDALRFVLLDDLAAGGTIYITDRAWTGSAFTNAAGEGTFTYVAPGGGTTAGTIITITAAQLTAAGITLSNAGETLYMYQGGADTPTRFLFAMDIADGNTTFNGNLTNTGLTNGVNAVAVQHDNAVYAGTPTRIPAAQLTDIATTTRWHGTDQDDIGGTPNYTEVHDTTNTNAFNTPDMVMITGMAGGGQSDAILRIGNDANDNGGSNVGTGLTRLFQDNPAFAHISDVSFDLENGFFFFVDSDGNFINRIMRGNIADIVNSNSSPTFTQIFATDGQNNGAGPVMQGEIINGIEINTTTNKIYWIDGSFSGDFEGGWEVRSINYDGTGLSLITIIDTENGMGSPFGISGVAEYAVRTSTNTMYVVSSLGSVDGFGNVNVLQNHILSVNLTTGAITILALDLADPRSNTGGGAYNEGRLNPVEGQIIALDVDQNTGIIYFATQPISANDHGGIFSYNPATDDLQELWDQPTNNAHSTLQTFPTNPITHLEVDEIGGRIYVSDISDTDSEFDGTPATNEDDASIFSLAIGAALGTAPTLFQRVVEVTANGSPLGMEIDYAPVTAVTAANTTYTESTNGPGSPAGPVIVVINASTVTDPDNTQIQGAIVAITGNFFTGDTLSFTNSGGITGSYNAANGVVTFTGLATLAQYQTVLNSIRYTNAGDNPTNYGNFTSRTISFTTFDGLAYSDPVTANITVVGINDAPVNTVSTPQAASEDVGKVITGLSVTDPDADPANEDITVTLSVLHGKITIFTGVPNGIQVSDVVNNGTGTVTITATQNEINATFGNAAGVTYLNTLDFNGVDTLTIVTNDLGNNGNDPGLTGNGTSEQDSDNVTINIAPVNDAPVVAGDGTEDSVTILEDTPSAVGQSVNSLFLGQYTDQKDNQIPNGGASSAGAFTGIAVVANASSGATGQWQWLNGAVWTDINTITLATSKLFDINTQIRFNPTLNYNGAEPLLTVVLIDNSLGFTITNGQTVNLSGPGATGGTTAYSQGTVVLGGTITPVNDAPTSTNLSADAATWTENGSAAFLDVGVNATIADVDSPNFDTGTLTVALGAGAVPAQDQLSVLNEGNAAGQIGVGAGTVSFGGVQFATFTGGGAGGSSLVFTFDPDATPAAIQALIHRIQYSNSGGDNPTGGSRGIVWTLVDGDGVLNSGADTLVVNSTVNVIAVNDAPSGADKTVGINEDGTYTFATADFGFTDPLDNNALLAVKITTLATDGKLFYDSDGPGGAAPVQVTLGQTISAIDIAAGKLTFVPDSNENGSPYASFTFQVQDDGGVLNGGVDLDQSPNTFTFNVAAVNDAPVNTVPGTQTINEDGTITFTGGTAISVNDVDVGAGNLTVTLSMTNGQLTLSTTAGLSFSNGDGTDDTTMTFSGTQAAINAALANLLYESTLNYNGPDTLTITTNDNGNTGLDPGATGDGSSEQDSDTVLINITPINDTPVVSVVASVGSIEQVAGTIDATATISDVELGALNNYAGSALTVGRNGGPGAQDLLTFGASGAFTVNGSNLEAGGLVFATFTGGNGSNLVITFTSSGTPATQTLVNAVVQSLQYTFTGDTPPASIVMNYSFNDGAPGNAGQGGGGSPTGTDAITINITDTPENAPPVVDLNGAGAGIDNSANYTENDASGFIAPSVTVSDADDTNIEGATIQIGAGFLTGFDYLTVNGGTTGNIGAISFNYVAATGTLTLTGTDTLAAYQAVLAQVGFESTSNDPGATRTISWTVNDGTDNSAAATTTVTVTQVNDEPTLTATGATATLTEGGAAVDLFSAVTASTIEAGQTFTSLTLTVTNVTDGAFETLTFDGSTVALTNGNAVTTATNGLNVTVTVAAGTATVTFSGAALNAAQLQTLVDNLAYGNSSQNPTDADRVITITQLVDSGSNVPSNDNTATLAIAATVNVDPLNDPPVNSVPGAQTINEDGSFTLSTGNGNAISVADVDATTLTVTLTVTNGTLTLASTAGLSFGAGDGTADLTMTFSGTAAAINAALGSGLTYNPTTNYNGPDSIQVVTTDNGQTGAGGTQSDTDSVAITVNPVNDAPSGTDNAVTINEDATYVFTNADFGFSDPVEGHALEAVIFTTLPVPGTLFYDADGVGGAAPVAVTAGQAILASEIALGKVTFVPAANANGVPFTSFTFQVRDNGGTTNGGQNTDQSPNTFTFSVTALNDAPVNSVPGAQSVNEDGSFTLSTGNGNAISVADVDATTLTVTLTVTHGTMTLASTAGLSFGAGDGTADATMTFSGTAAAINAALGAGLTYNPTANYNGPDAIQVVTSDNGQTGTGGTQTDSDSIAITVNSVNDAPAGTDGSTTINEDGSYVLHAADFGFSDPVEGNGFAGVVITTLPTSGILVFDADGPGGLPGVLASAGQFVTAAQLALGALTYFPVGNANGTPYASFTFQVRDDGGTTNGGVNTDQSPNTFTFNVTAVNDAPVNSVPGAQTINEDGSFTLSTGNGNAISVADVDASTLTVTLTVANGTLTLASTAGLSFGAGDGTADLTMTFSGTAAAINAALGSGLTYNPTANYNGSDSIQVVTSDNGQTGTGGTQTDSDSISITINSVNDAPAGANNTLTGSEDDPVVFTAADFGFSDASDSPANSLLAVKVTTLPGTGTLFLDSDGPGGAAPVAVSAGQFISVADINAGHFYFLGALDGYGSPYASFTFQVQDNGGTALSGVNLDPSANTLTINLTPDDLPPAVDLDGLSPTIDYATAYTENGPAVSIGIAIDVSDPDEFTLSDQVEKITVTITDYEAGDQLTFAGGIPGTLSVSQSVVLGQLVMTITGPAASADYELALQQLRYSSTSDDPTDGGTNTNRVITFVANDGTLDGAAATATIAINAIDDPAVAQPDAFVTDEGTPVSGSLFADNGSGADSDPDGPPLSISAVNGSGANVGVQITLASGALLTVNANGTFTYDPNGAFDPTPTPGSGATNQPVPDSFTYTLAGGNTVTVSLTINGLDTDDLLIGSAGQDVLIAGVGNDTINGLGDNDSIDGGSGTDTALFSGPVTLADTAIGWLVTGADGNDFIQNVEIVQAGAQRTLLVGATGFGTLQAALNVANNGDIVRIAAGPTTATATYSDSGLIVIGQPGSVLNLTLTTATGFGISVYGAAGADHITTGDGNDTINGGAGADAMAGGLGNDTYYIDNVGDTIAEVYVDGADIAYSTVSYTLNAGAELELLSTASIAGTGAINFTGNEYNNTLWGNNGANILSGGGGLDTLVGFGGDDIYNVTVGTEIIVENVGGGTDIVYSAVNYTLTAGAEVELLSTTSIGGTGAIALTGNELNNTIWGNNGANVLSGGGGLDTLVGFKGDDVYTITAGTEVIVENLGEGTDIAYASTSYTLTSGASVELLSTNSIAGTSAINLTGNQLDNTLWGNNGANVLNGGFGADTLVGFGGADTFAFTTGLGGGNVDKMADFLSGTDKVALDDAVFTTIGGLGALNANAFVAGTAALDANDRIIYDSATGNIYYDADGNGAGGQVLFATVDAGTVLVASDFQVI